MKSLRFVAVALVLVLASSSRAIRAEDKKASGQPQMSPQEQAMMEKYMKAAQPGPEHQKLARLAGKWKLVVTSWMAPGAPPQKSEGTAEFTSTLGGRYLEQVVHGSMGDQPFEGRGVEGFDNVTQQRFGTWIDNMTTGVMVSYGKCAADAKKCTFKGTMPDAAAGKPVPITETVTYADDNHFTFELQAPASNGKTFKALEIAYTRQ